MIGPATSAIWLASSTARSSSRPCPTTSVTNPIRSARPASMTSPVIDSRRAMAAPTRWGSRAVMPPPGRMPTRAWVSANTARSEATRKSHPSHLQAAGECRAVDRADDGRVHLRDGGDAAVRSELLEVRHPVALGFLEVHGGAERRIRAGEHHRTHRFVGVGVGQRRVEGSDQVTVQRVFAPRVGSSSAPAPIRGRWPRRAARCSFDRLT